MSGGGGDGGGGGYMFQSPESIGLGYAIAIALGLIVLLSSVLLASYLCCRRRRLLRRQDRAQEIPVHAAAGVIIPRIIFVAEDDDDEGGGGGGGGGGGVQGLGQAVINSYPKFPFSGAAKDRPNADAVCSICLCDYKDGEMLRMLPDCRHYFHLLCVDGWLRLNASCPICRTSPLPTPISTPLAEVVPLSQYPARTRR